MAKNQKTITKKKTTKPKNQNQIYKIVKDNPNKTAYGQRLYRVIVGVDFYGKQPVYSCYRKNGKHGFVIDKIKFNSTQLDDQRFIFTENDFENLLDFLTNIDVVDLYTIASIGCKEVDPISLLPIL